MTKEAIILCGGCDGKGRDGNLVCMMCRGKGVLRVVPPHNCYSHAVQVRTDGPLGHGWECKVCGNFLQAG